VCCFGDAMKDFTRANRLRDRPAVDRIAFEVLSAGDRHGLAVLTREFAVAHFKVGSLDRCLDVLDSMERVASQVDRRGRRDADVVVALHAARAQFNAPALLRVSTPATLN
jgi:hypothetical protein